ncbi:hypothetical protein ACFC8N_42750 [Streptomyces sp. NPDC055966]|uniref:hypothetical protein n=1 Tax=Streptomyces sp. NPDC055966 TaxID=3345669 RepID=UPI0035E1A3FE
MSTTTELISRAIRLLDSNEPQDRDVNKANAAARVATARALSDLAEAARTDTNRPAFPTQNAWPAGVTARILTRAGILLRNPNATVDIHDNHRSTAICQTCGRSKNHGIEYRDEVLDWAHDHASTCTALPNPAA